MEEDAYIHGQLIINASFSHLAQLLSEAGFQAEIRQSSHYEGGQYLSLRSPNKARWTFEKIGNEEYLITADEQAMPQLHAFATLLSSFFSQHNWRHRLEIYNAKDELMYYLHYHWSAA